METGYDLTQELRGWVSPSLIEANHILSLSRQELEQAVLAEMESNPALEQEDLLACPGCGGILEGPYCPVCQVQQHEDAPAERHDDMQDLLVSLPQTREDSDDFDPLTLVAQGIDIREQILRDARTLLAPEDHPIAEYLVDGIDDRGLLACDLERLETVACLPRERIDAVIAVIQEVAPVGVGARTLEESLVLQLDYLASTGVEPPRHAREIIERFLNELGAHRFGQIARALSITPEEVEEARDFIRTRLNPFPLQSQQARSWRTPTGAQYVAPDVVISVKDGDLHVEVVDTSHFHLRLNAMYDRLSSDLGRRRAQQRQSGDGSAEQADTTAPVAAAPAVTGADREHIRSHTSRARLFIANIQQRRETLLRISMCIAELQEPFLRGGVRELRPLTRATVAQQVGVHESTVSRATANKYAMLPNRKVIPFSDFFTPSLSIKDVIREIVLDEQGNGEHLTDRRISQMLEDRGIRVARRTVAKYRAELRILPSTMR